MRFTKIKQNEIDNAKSAISISLLFAFYELDSSKAFIGLK